MGPRFEALLASDVTLPMAKQWPGPLVLGKPGSPKKQGESTWTLKGTW